MAPAARAAARRAGAPLGCGHCCGGPEGRRAGAGSGPRKWLLGRDCRRRPEAVAFPGPGRELASPGAGRLWLARVFGVSRKSGLGGGAGLLVALPGVQLCARGKDGCTNSLCPVAPEHLV